MTIALPTSPSLGQTYPYAGRNWQWMGWRWSAVSQYPEWPNGFQASTKQNWYETLVTTAAIPVGAASTGVLLTYA